MAPPSQVEEEYSEIEEEYSELEEYLRCPWYIPLRLPVLVRKRVSDASNHALEDQP